MPSQSIPKTFCIDCGKIPKRWYGLRCGTCYGRVYVAEHREEVRAKRAQHHAAHRDRDNANLAQYRATHKAERAVWLAANREQLRDKRRIYLAQYNASHREQLRIAARDIRARRRARHHGGAGKRLSFQAIYDRDRGICHICGRPVERAKMSLDHVVPLAKGGTHTFENVRVSHYPCNRRRNAYGPGQPYLI